MILTIPPELEKILKERASTSGISAESLALKTLEATLSRRNDKMLSHEDWSARLKRVGLPGMGVSLSDEAFSSESLYE